MPTKKTTQLLFTSDLGGNTFTRLLVRLHEDGDKIVVEDADRGHISVWISRADFAEIARQISEWEVGEPAA